VTDRLPERCHVVLPGLPAGGNVVVCVRGEVGVRVTRLNFGCYPEARKVVRELNRSADIGVEAERAMLIGCLIGWEVLGRPPQAAQRAPARVLH
jgi:hypothetical protein